MTRHAEGETARAKLRVGALIKLMTPMDRAQTRQRLVGQRKNQIDELKLLKVEVQRQINELDALREKCAKAGSFREAVHQLEAALITRALETSNGRVKRAAELLGMSYQALQFILNGRHKDIAHLRRPVVKRRKRKI